MILCRFADQTAVQLPAERRLIGTVECPYKTAYSHLPYYLTQKQVSSVMDSPNHIIALYYFVLACLTLLHYFFLCLGLREL